MKIALCVFALNLGGIATLLDLLRRGLAREEHDVRILTTYRAGNFFDQAHANGWALKNVSNNEISLKRRIENLYAELCDNYDAVILNHSHETQLVLPALPPAIIRLAVQHNATERVTRGNSLNHHYYDAWIGVSPLATESIRACCSADVLVTTIPNGISADPVNSPRPRDPQKVLYVGRIDERDKNVLVLPRIAAELRKSGGTPFSFTLAGDGPGQKKLLKLIRALKVDGDFAFFGRVERSVALEEMRRHEYLISPSRREGLPFALIEAMGCGALPVTSDIPVHRWMLDADVGHLTAPPDDFRAFAQRIRFLADNPVLRSGIRSRLVQRQKSLFSEEACVKGYRDLLNRVQASQRKHSQVPFSDIPLPPLDRFKCGPMFCFLKQAQMYLKSI